MKKSHIFKNKILIIMMAWSSLISFLEFFALSRSKTLSKTLVSGWLKRAWCTIDWAGHALSVEIFARCFKTWLFSPSSP